MLACHRVLSVASSDVCRVFYQLYNFFRVQNALRPTLAASNIHRQPLHAGTAPEAGPIRISSTVRATLATPPVRFFSTSAVSEPGCPTSRTTCRTYASAFRSLELILHRPPARRKPLGKEHILARVPQC